MHIRSKFDGRKQINRSQSGAWDEGVLELCYAKTMELIGDQKCGNQSILINLTKYSQRCQGKNSTTGADALGKYQLAGIYML